MKLFFFALDLFLSFLFPKKQRPKKKKLDPQRRRLNDYFIPSLPLNSLHPIGETGTEATGEGEKAAAGWAAGEGAGEAAAGMEGAAAGVGGGGGGGGGGDGEGALLLLSIGETGVAPCPPQKG